MIDRVCVSLSVMHTEGTVNLQEFSEAVFFEGQTDLLLSSSDIRLRSKRDCHSKHITRLFAVSLLHYFNGLLSSSLTQNVMFSLCQNSRSILTSQMSLWSDNGVKNRFECSPHIPWCHADLSRLLLNFFMMVRLHF